MTPAPFIKPETWEEFFFPLQDMPNKEKAVNYIWSLYEFPENQKSLFFDFDSSLPEIQMFTNKVQAIIQFLGPNKNKISLSDQDILIMTGNLVFIMVILALFYSEGDVELVFHSSKWLRLVFADFNTRKFKEAHGDYATLKCYVFLLCSGRKVHVSLNEQLRLDNSRSQEVVLSDNFQGIMFKHNFINSKGVLSQQSRLMSTIYQGGTFNQYIKMSAGDQSPCKPPEHSSNAEFVSAITNADERTARTNITQERQVAGERNRPEPRAMKAKRSAAVEEAKRTANAKETQAALKIVQAPEEPTEIAVEPKQRVERANSAVHKESTDAAAQEEQVMLEIEGTKEQIMNLISYLPLELISTLVLK